MGRWMPLQSNRWIWVPALLCALLLCAAMPVRAEAPLALLGSGQRVSAGVGYACAIDGQGRLNCWGRSAAQFGTPPEGHYASVALGESASCAVRSDGEAVCWPQSAGDLATPSPGPWRSLAAGWGEACGLRPDGRLQCWGKKNGVAAAAPVSGRFIAVSISALDGCAIRIDGTLQCWSVNTPGYLDTPPPGRFLRVSVADYHACALRADGRVLCWGPGLNGSNDAPETDGFVDVSVGRYHGCALHEHGNVVCWGTQLGSPDVAVVAPQGEFTDITSAYDYNCGRKADGTAQCWNGNPFEEWPLSANSPALNSVAVGGGEVCVLDTEGEAHCAGSMPSMQPPPGRYSQLSLGSTSGCGILHDGRATCWGASLGPTPTGAMSKISVGDAHACGVLTHGALVCWGDNNFGQSDVPQGVYLAVAAGERYSCAITTGETVSCWGQDPLVWDIPLGTGFRTLVAGDNVVCANREFGPSQCWGDGSTWFWWVDQIWYPVAAVGDFFVCWEVNHYVFCEGDPTREVPDFPAGNFIAIAASGDQACAIDTNRLFCGGSERFERRFDTMRIGTGSVAAGGAHTCNVDNGGLIDCWGDNAAGQRESPRIRARALDTNADHACATGTANMLHCWGDDRRGGNLPPPGLATRSVDLGQYNGCAVRSDGSPACWGWDINGQSMPPPGLFRSIATGLNHSCGLRDDNTLACWGYGADGQINAPLGAFLAIDVGERHSCAIGIDGGLRCWGLDSEGQATPPGGGDALYRALSTGSFHNCAIRSDGTLVCWGRNNDGQAMPPLDGRFLSVSAGAAHTCAIRDDGARLCWGSNTSGQSPTVTIGPDALPHGELNVPYEVAFSMIASPGYSPRSPEFKLFPNTLPDWIELGKDGVLRMHPQSTGAFDFVVEASDDNGFVAHRSYHLVIGSVTDGTPPITKAFIDGTLGDQDWYTSDVNIRWTYSDPESGIVDVSGCLDMLVTEDGLFATSTCIVTSRDGGTSADSAGVKRDATPPRIDVRFQPQPTPNPEGWFNSAVTAVYSCSDATSGVRGACPEDMTLDGEGTLSFPMQSISDNAGNTASTPAIIVHLDVTRPMLWAVMPPAQLPVGASHDFQLSATDALSGILSQACAPIDTATPGVRTAICTAIDRAGNSASLSGQYEVVASVAGVGRSARPVQSAPRPRIKPAAQPVRRSVKPLKARAR